MKKNLFTSLLIIICFTTNAQNPYLNDVNTQLRNMFLNVTFPNNNIKFLYERSAKLSDSSFYSRTSPDTLVTTTWYQIYDEMYYAAHDTVPHKTHEQIETYANNFAGDTIPLAIMDYEYFYLNNQALPKGLYLVQITNNSEKLTQILTID